MTIEPWTVYGNSRMFVNIHRCGDDDEYVWNPEISFVLDDEEEENGTLKNVFCMLTDVWEASAQDALLAVVENLACLWDNISDTAFVSVDGEIVEEMSISDLMGETE